VKDLGMKQILVTDFVVQPFLEKKTFRNSKSLGRNSNSSPKINFPAKFIQKFA